mmetsp:Transcript_51473/g.145075  ORF Transcript_51473/g.145075 Transcript_51473/m.145075 type:complete len:386 (+) Transcript_51473:691-1848(+)
MRLEVLREPEAELLGQDPQRREFRGLHAEAAGALGDEDGGLGARDVLYRQEVRHPLAERRGHVRLRQYAVEQCLEWGWLPIAVQLDLVRGVFHGLDELGDEREGQPEVADDGPGLVAPRVVRGAGEDVEARAEDCVPDPEDDWDDLRRAARGDLVQVYGGLGQREAAGRLQHDGDILHGLLALERDEEAHRALHHHAVHAPHGVVGVCVVLLARVEVRGHLGPDPQLLLGLPRALAVRLPDDPQEVLVLLFHLVVVQFLHLRVHEAGGGRVGAQVARLHPPLAVHAHDHPPDAADGLHEDLHGEHVLEPRAPDQLHLLEDHEVPGVRADEEVVHRRGVGRLRRQPVAGGGGDVVLAEALLQPDPAVFLDREHRVLADDEYLLLAG